MNRLFVALFFNKLELLCLHAVKSFHVLLFNIRNFVHQQFLSDFMLIINLLTVKWFQVLLFMTNNSI